MDLPVLKRRHYNDIGVILCFTNLFILDFYRQRQKSRCWLHQIFRMSKYFVVEWKLKCWGMIPSPIYDLMENKVFFGLCYVTHLWYIHSRERKTLLPCVLFEDDLGFWSLSRIKLQLASFMFYHLQYVELVIIWNDKFHIFLFYGHSGCVLVHRQLDYR